jgi:hypothetical protein
MRLEIPMNVKTDQETTPLEETDYSFVKQEIALKSQPQRGQERECQAPMDRDLGWKQDIYPINKHIYWKARIKPKFRNNVAKFSY